MILKFIFLEQLEHWLNLEAAHRLKTFKLQTETLPKTTSDR